MSIIYRECAQRKNLNVQRENCRNRLRKNVQVFFLRQQLGADVKHTGKL